MTKQGWIVTGTAATVFALIVATAYIASRQTSKAATPAAPFRARPGSMRDQVVPMLSETQEKLGLTDVSGAPVTLDSDSGPQNLTIHLSTSVIAEAAQAALNAPTPEAGIERLNQDLANDAPRDQISDIQTALSALHLRKDPPDLEAAADAAMAALDSARTPEQRLRSAVAEASVLQAMGRIDDARSTVDAALRANPQPSEDRLRLLLLDAAMAQDAGDEAAAERSLRALIDEAAPLMDGAPASLDHAYRLAALKLARLYRSQGRTAESAALVDTMEALRAPADAAGLSTGPVQGGATDDAGSPGYSQ